MDPYPVTIHLVDDDEIFRSLVAASIRLACSGNLDDYDAGSWLTRSHSTPPDILLLDFWAGGRDNTPLISHLATAWPTTMIGVLTTPPGSRREARTRDAGAFVCYEKRSVHVKHLGEYLLHDLHLFRRERAGEHVTAPSSHDRFVEATGWA